MSKLRAQLGTPRVRETASRGKGYVMPLILGKSLAHEATPPNRGFFDRKDFVSPEPHCLGRIVSQSNTAKVLFEAYSVLHVCGSRGKQRRFVFLALASGLSALDSFLS